MVRLQLLLDPEFEDAIPSPDDLEFRYVLDGNNLDYRLLFAMAGNELSDQHVAFRAPALDTTAKGDAITLDEPSVLPTPRITRKRRNWRKEERRLLSVVRRKPPPASARA